MTKTGKTPQSLRVENTKTVLASVLDSPEPPSRAQLATRTGLTRATVSRLVDYLLEVNLIEELPPVRPHVGRPANPLIAKGRTMVMIGMEVNLAYLSVVVMDLAGNILFTAVDQRDSRQASPQLICEMLGEMLGRWSRPRSTTVLGAGLCVPGLVDRSRGVVVTAPNLGWADVDIAGQLSTTIGALGRVIVVNEADAAAYGVLYQRPGALSATRDFIYVSGEVGIGAAVVAGGSVFEGTHGWAGEFGHMCVERSGPRCGCGSNGCLEQYVGQDALLRNAGLPREAGVGELIERFDAGDAGVRDAVDLAAVSLGSALANALNLLDLDTVVFGGNFALLYPRLEMILRSELKYRVLASRWKDIELLVDERGNTAAAIGICLQHFEIFLSDPNSWLEQVLS
ncbi:ROK family transcriptional regulator [Actinotignum timonense]|nr:ROK family transcriptional regulator [Actinotignum timonense]